MSVSLLLPPKETFAMCQRTAFWAYSTESENESSSPFYLFVIYAFSSFLHFRHFYTSAGQTCIAVVSKSKIDEEKLSSGTNDDYPDLSNHARIGTLRYCHHHKPLLYSKNFAKLFSTQRHASSCGDVLGLCDMGQTHPK